ncbi:MAG: homocysteine S-methyltransferase family protein, partial [Deltaproteobacteria bacterium]
MAQCIRAGARLIGGCCGTSPAHISALAEVLKYKRVKQ